MRLAVQSTLAVLYSGGLDSSILVARLLAEGHRVQPVYIDSGLFWQPTELEAARRFLQALGSSALADLVVLDLPLRDLYDDHWSVTGKGIPTADETDEAVYLPGRNPLLMVKAQVWCRLHGVEWLALGSLKNNPFSDATDEFFRQFEGAMNRAVMGHVELVRPFAMLDKRQVMELGRHAPLELTLSCLAPVGDRHCGRCNKCEERRLAFHGSGLNDPTRYFAESRSVSN